MAGSKKVPKANGQPVKRENKRPTVIRIDPDLLKRIDLGATRLGLSRSAFIVSSAAEKLDHMDRITHHSDPN